LRYSNYRFTPVTPATHRRINGRPGNELARDLRDVFGWSRPFDTALLEPKALALMREAGVLVDEGDLLHSSIRVLTLDDMLLMHSAWPTHADDAVFFGPDTYRFISALQRAFAWLDASPVRALDVGCGTGADALTIARTFSHAAVIGIDVNPKVLELATVNARLAGLHNVTLYLFWETVQFIN